MSTLYKQLLLFPDRAENLGQFSTYDVELDHWRSLSSVFRQTFQSVFERGSSSILLVHGAQGTGKTLFSRRLEQDYKRSADGACSPDAKNLWHTLVGDEPPTRATIAAATSGSMLRRVEPTSGWLHELRTFAKLDSRRARIFVVDDAQKDVFLREWAGLTQMEYQAFKARREEAVALGSVAERLVEDCRGDFQRSIFLLLSNDAPRMRELKDHIDRSHLRLARVLELPLPAPSVKEQIIRKNTNRLNRVSYWYCLDAAGKEGRSSVHEVLTDPEQGFTSSFFAVSDALQSRDLRRSGRPANKGLITLVTLGAPPSLAKGFVDDHELQAQEDHLGPHLGVWTLREQWASTLAEGSDREIARRAQMLESEIALRWVSLDMRATFALCQPATPFDLGERILNIVRFAPSVAKPAELRRSVGDCLELEAELERRMEGSLDAAFEAFHQRFLEQGQGRSRWYEAELSKRLGRYGNGFRLFPAVRPDFIVEEYTPCAVTSVRAREPSEISEAIRRACHVIEVTAYLQSDLHGLREYLLGKVERYASLLESL